MSVKLSIITIILMLAGVSLVGCAGVNTRYENTDFEDVHPPPPGYRAERIQPPGSVPPSEELYLEYIGTALQQHIDLFLAPADRGGQWSNLQVSQGFITNGNPDTSARTFFVSHNGYHLGFLSVTYYNGRFLSNLSRSSHENIAAIINDNIPIAVIELPSGDVFIQTKDNWFHLTTADRIAIDFGDNLPEIFEIPHEKAVIVFSDI